jgi:SlyX protein
MDQRLIDLEIKISHQESAVDALQQIVYEQQKAIDRLETRLEKLTKKLEGDLEIGPASEKPPHY